MPLSLSKILLCFWLAQDVEIRFGPETFGYGGQPNDDLSLPNPGYFNALDKRIKQAARRKVRVNIEPVSEELLRLNGPDKAREFGRYLARRYVKYKNIVWRTGHLTKGPARDALEAGLGEY
jgi:hypothetical protein